LVQMCVNFLYALTIINGGGRSYALGVSHVS